MRSLAAALRPIAAHLSAAPRIYADANVPATVVAAMRRDLGWDVLFVMEDDALRRAPDRQHFDRARDLGRTLVTLDHDFLDARHYPPGDGPGVIVCTAPDERLLLRILRHADQVLLRGAAGTDAPLAGRTIELTLSVLQHESNPDRRRRSRPARSRRRRTHARR